MRKLKLLSTSVFGITLIACATLLTPTPYESNAVEATTESTSISYEQEYIGGLDLKNDFISETKVEVKEIKSYQEEKKEEAKFLWTTDKVNLRSNASINSDTIITLDKRVKVKLLDAQKKTSSKWVKVEYNDKIGYIYSKYLRDSELPSLDFTDEEIELMAKIVWLEARGEKDDSGLAAVVYIIINRIKSEEFPDDLLSVLSEKNAFSSWKLLDTAQPSEREMEIVDEVLNGQWDGLLTDDYVYFSTTPRNNNGTIKIGNHYFCRQDTK